MELSYHLGKSCRFDPQTFSPLFRLVSFIHNCGNIVKRDPQPIKNKSFFFLGEVLAIP